MPEDDIAPPSSPDATTEADMLAATDLFGGLDATTRRTVAASMQRRNIARSEVLFLEGDPGDGLYVVVAGSVAVFRTSPGGERAVLTVISAPGTLGEIALLNGTARTASVQALEDSVVLMMTRSDFLGLFRREAVVVDVLLRSLGNMVRRLTEQTADHVFLDLGGRVAKALLTVTANQKHGHVTLSQGQLADLVGGSRQSVNQTINGFSNRGYIHTRGRTIYIDDRTALERRAGVVP